MGWLAVRITLCETRAATEDLPATSQGFPMTFYFPNLNSFQRKRRCVSLRWLFNNVFEFLVKVGGRVHA